MMALGVSASSQEKTSRNVLMSLPTAEMFLSAIVIVFLGLASGKNTILYDKLMRCIGQPSTNLRDTILQVSRCSDNEFVHCYEDSVTGPGTLFLLPSDCGFIDSFKVTTYKCTWWIKTTRTAWIHILLFRLHFVDFPCTIEYVRLIEHVTDNLYCGERFPWKYYAASKTVSIQFHSDVYLHTDKGIFQIYFQDGSPIRHKTHILRIRLSELHSMQLNDQHSFLTIHFLYLIAHRLKAIQANISSLPSAIVTVYDGPGVRSPQKSVSDNVTSSSFVMLVTVHKAGSSRKQQPYLFLKYTTTGTLLDKCLEYRYSISEAVSFFTKPTKHQHGAYGCIWNVPLHSHNIRFSNLVILGPMTLLDNESCIYGGTFIFSRKNDTNVEEVFAQCRRNKYAELTRLFDIRDEEVVVATIAFHQYTITDDRSYVAKTFNNVDEVYINRVRNCELKQICELSVSFPITPNTFSTVATVVQFIGNSHFSTRIEFSQQTAPAYAAVFESSMCHTPPYYSCRCVILQFEYSTPVSHFVREAHRADKYIMHYTEEDLFVLNSHTLLHNLHGIDISFASSLTLNFSECRGNYTRLWWVLTFKKLDFHDIGFRKVANVFHSIPLQPKVNPESPWLSGDHTFSLPTLPNKKTVYWILLHIMPPLRDLVTDNDETQTKVCIPGMSYYDAQLHVEILTPEMDKSVVFTVSDHSHVEDETDFPRRQMCSVGLQCNTCNIILIYRDFPREYHQPQLAMQVSRTSNRKTQAASVTSIKHIQVFKISNRFVNLCSAKIIIL